MCYNSLVYSDQQQNPTCTTRSSAAPTSWSTWMIFRTSSWRRGNSQQALRSDPTTPSTSTNRDIDGWKHSVLSRTQHHQQRRLYYELGLAGSYNNTLLEEADGELPASNSTGSSSTEGTKHSDEQSASYNAWPTQDPTFVTQQRNLHEHCSSNIIGSAEAQTSTSIRQRSSTLQADYTTNR